ncbi:MAG TPA: Eco57I restriction-modification methylase domain-containing protein [Thermodesulfobacteriota bacterium]|nr:Eco57I restriction-modification methylase domain-containing protein [Thermodesulfobacteriota bacterium]
MEYSSTLPLFQAQNQNTDSLNEAIQLMSESGVEDRGAIYTRKEVVDFLLDLIEYVQNKPLYKFGLLEPSFGEGDFLIPAIERLIKSYKMHHEAGKYTLLKDAVRGVELNKVSFERAKKKILNLLRNDFDEEQSRDIVDSWLICGDYLLQSFNLKFDFVVGNPPYIRQETIPEVLLKEYKKRYTTIYDRADIYIPFIEKSLLHLSRKGTLGFICSDRWMKNRYGSSLRKMIADRFHLKIYVDMVNTPAFHTEVDAYPAITVIVNGKGSKTKIYHRPEIDSSKLKLLAKTLLSDEEEGGDDVIRSMANVASGSQPWLVQSAEYLSLIRRLEEGFPDLEKSGCRVGIGVATGLDKVFINSYDEMDVEADRKLALVTTKDIRNEAIEWHGLGVINTFADNGGLVDLENYPKLKKYLESRKELILKRHIARRSPEKWYRTIDRIYPHLAGIPKLLIPDIKGTLHIIYESGKFYPHHNLYYILSHEWNLKVLRTVLLSGIAQMFVSAYSTRMRGDYLRYQAQHLRRIRLPKWSEISSDSRNRLIVAAENGNIDRCEDLIFGLYGLSDSEISFVKKFKS